MPDVLVLGAGIAGLACAGLLVAAGAEVLVLDKGRGVGGRAATRRIDGQPVDHGLPFFHGTSRAFLDALDQVPATPIPGWPARVVGSGPPCNPTAFDPRWRARRLAFAEGSSAFPKSLARGLEVRSGVRVTRLHTRPGAIGVEDEAGQRWEAPDLVLALPLEQSAALLGEHPGLRGARALLSSAGSSPCQALIALYDGPDDPLEGELFLPEDSNLLKLIAHDSSKRPLPRRRVLVLQARPAWSAAHLEAPADEVSAALLAEAGRLLGPWAASPATVIHHRWRYAQVQSGAAFARPFLIALDGARLGLTGEAFHPSCGAEGAFLAGQRLARDLLESAHA